MTSSTAPNLASLPIELATMVAGNLSPDDLLTVRSLNQTWQSISNELVAELIPQKLRHLHVLTTREGLLTLQGILSVPKWRKEIRSIDFIDHGFYFIESDRFWRDDGAKSQWLGYFAIEERQEKNMLDNIIPAQRRFEGSEEALDILTNIFQSLQMVIDLQEVNFGMRRVLNTACLGLRHAIDDIGVMEDGGYGHIQDLSARLAQETTELNFMLGRSGLASQAMKRSGFHKRVVRLNIRARRSQRLRSDKRALAVPKKLACPGIELSGLRSLTLSDPDHVHSLSKNTGGVLLVRELTISGCNTETSCRHCVDLIQGLEKVALPRTTTLKLRNMSLGEANLVLFFTRVQSLRLKDLSLRGVRLLHGSWRGVFGTVGKSLNVTRILREQELLE